MTMGKTRQRHSDIKKDQNLKTKSETDGFNVSSKAKVHNGIRTNA